MKIIKIISRCIPLDDSSGRLSIYGVNKLSGSSGLLRKSRPMAGMAGVSINWQREILEGLIPIKLIEGANRTYKSLNLSASKTKT